MVSDDGLIGERSKRMLQLSGGEWLFYGGISIMGTAVMLAIVCVAVFGISGKTLKKQLEEEYGKPEI